MSLYRGYVSASGTCAGRAQPGAEALMAWWLGAYGSRGATDLGIYGCKMVGTTSTPSVHQEGRADDLGIPVGAAWGQGAVDALVANSAELGIQLVIYRLRIWSGSDPANADGSPKWKTYDVPPGGSEHNEHAHAELSWDAAAHLTVARINAVMEAQMPLSPDDLLKIKGTVEAGLVAYFGHVANRDAAGYRGPSPNNADMFSLAVHNALTGDLAALAVKISEAISEQSPEVGGAHPEVIEAALRKVFADAGTA